MPKNLAEVQAELARISNRAKELVGQALRRGTISRTEHDQYVRELSETGNVTRVLVELELEDADSIRNRADLAQQVERALAGLARQGGARVVTGSTKVTLDAIDPANEDGYEEPDFGDQDDPQDDDPQDNEETGATRNEQLVTIDTRVYNSNPLRGNQQVVAERVEAVLGALGRQFGINMVRGSTVVDVTGDAVRITHRATGEVHLATQGNSRIEGALGQLARDNGTQLVPGSVRVTV